MLVGAIVCLHGLSLGRNFRKYFLKFFHCSRTRAQPYFIENHLVSVCFIAYITDISVTDSTQGQASHLALESLKKCISMKKLSRSNDNTSSPFLKAAWTW